MIYFLVTDVGADLVFFFLSKRIFACKKVESDTFANGLDLGR